MTFQDGSDAGEKEYVPHEYEMNEDDIKFYKKFYKKNLWSFKSKIEINDNFDDRDMIYDSEEEA